MSSVVVQPLRRSSARLSAVRASRPASSSPSTTASGRAYDRPPSMMPRVGVPAQTWVCPLMKPGSTSSRRASIRVWRPATRPCRTSAMARAASLTFGRPRTRGAVKA